MGNLKTLILHSVLQHVVNTLNTPPLHQSRIKHSGVILGGSEEMLSSVCLMNRSLKGLLLLSEHDELDLYCLSTVTET